MCKGENCHVHASNKSYRGYCLNCFIHKFPKEKASRNYKTKETAVAQFVLEHFPNMHWHWDKTVLDGCSRRRPDLLHDLGYQVLMAEINENLHKKYDTSCENKRLMQLWQDAGERPIILLRFNPDAYIAADGSRVTSCWGMDGKGILVVKKREEWAARLEALRSAIAYWSMPENRTDKEVAKVVDLFYDGS